MRYPQLLDMVKSCCDTAVGLCSGLDHSEVFSCVFDSGITSDCDITDVCLVDDRIVDALPCVWVGVILPALRICGIKIDDHRTLAVYTGRSRIRIAGFLRLSINRDAVCIVGTIEVSLLLGNPCTIHSGGHLDALDPVRCGCRSAFIQI